MIKQESRRTDLKIMGSVKRLYFGAVLANSMGLPWNASRDKVSRCFLNPAGRQTLMLFQLDRVEEKPVSCLDGTLELLAPHRRFHHKTQQ